LRTTMLPPRSWPSHVGVSSCTNTSPPHSHARVCPPARRIAGGSIGLAELSHRYTECPTPVRCRRCEVETLVQRELHAQLRLVEDTETEPLATPNASAISCSVHDRARSSLARSRSTNLPPYPIRGS
jgi:hypothetical protein